MELGVDGDDFDQTQFDIGPNTDGSVSGFFSKKSKILIVSLSTPACLLHSLQSKKPEYMPGSIEHTIGSRRVSR